MNTDKAELISSILAGVLIIIASVSIIPHILSNVSMIAVSILILASCFIVFFN